MSDLLDAIAAGDRAGALAALEVPGAETEVDKEGVSALLLARYRGMIDLASAIAERREITLPEAAALGDLTAVRNHLEAGADVESHSVDGFTPLQLAAHFDNVGVAALLLRVGADLSARSTGRMTVQALHASAASTKGRCLPLLIALGADVNATQGGGFTALHEAALKKDAAMAELLLAAGADPRQRAADGRDAAEMAESSGDLPLAARLRA